MKQADLVVALLDATEPATHQDLAVIGACQKLRRPLIVALNKVDLLPPSAQARESLRREVQGKLRFAESPPLVDLSALHRRGIGELLNLLERMAVETSRRIPTPELNRALEAAVRRRSPAGKGGLARLYYITQTGGQPPSFVVFTNGVTIPPSYRRYLARHLREALGIELIPISIRFRRRAGGSS
jgi:GTP-binding protein